jgi:crotonobetainyl-CoA:carnitine CoA-transferase CaiB-like acyl-CoA transferase
MTGSLDGVVVLDLTRVLAGPLCTMMLGDLGAEIIKVERPGRGDDTRSWGPPFQGTESAYYLGVNRNKRSLGLDLSSEAGLEVLRALVKEVDVVIDNFKIGTLERWGLDDDWFASQAPDVVRCTISGYGSSGPKAGAPGYDFILQAETGLMSITGEADGPSMKLGVAIVDICTGMLATISVLSALRARDATGLGQRTEVTLHDTGLLMLANVASNHLISGDDAGRYGNGHPNIVPYRTFEAADGEIAISVGNDDQFDRLAGLLGHPEWGSDPRFGRNRDRVEHRELVDSMIQDVVQDRTRSEWIELLDEAGIPSGPINTVAEALDSPQTRGRGMVTEIGHPVVGMMKMPGIPSRQEGTPGAIRRHPPMLGEHTDEILGEYLAMPTAEIERLRSAGVV